MAAARLMSRLGTRATARTRALGVAPAHCVFLDDLGVNLKPARTLGMHTIKVDDPDVALAQLQALVGFPLDADA